MGKFGSNHRAAHLLLCLSLAALAPLAQATVLGNGETAAPDLLTPSGTELATTSGTISTPTFTTLFTASVFYRSGQQVLCRMPGLRVPVPQHLTRCERALYRV